MSYINPPLSCELCGSGNVQDLAEGLVAHDQMEGTVICKKCGAHWWKRWYTHAEWKAWINSPEEEEKTDRSMCSF